MNKALLLTTLLIGAQLEGCSYSRPPQTGFYCIDVSPGKAGEVEAFVRDTAAQLGFEVSKGTFPFEADNVHRAYEIHGGGVSLLIQTSMHSGEPDQFENRPTKANPYRWDMSAAKTGSSQHVSFERVLTAAVSSAKSRGFAVSKAPDGEACSTEE